MLSEPDRASMSEDDDATARELEEDAVYQRAFDESQQAIKSSEANVKESCYLRDELNEYINSLKEKKGSDGQALIRIPSNFETIVHSMNREDLTEKESGDRPWSHYLLLDGLNAEEDQEYQGRYNHVFSETKDVKIERGLAQIQLLDRQLKSAARKGASRGDEGGGEGEGSLPDRTFITKPSSSSGASSPMTGRSQLSSREAPSGSGTSRSMKSAAATILAEQRHLQYETAAGKKQHKLSTAAEQDRRLRVLLSEDADEGMPYLDQQLERELREVEAKLAPFGRLQRAAADEVAKEEGTPELEDGEYESISVQDYLLRQRLAREENIRVARVEQMLKQCISGVSLCRSSTSSSSSSSLCTRARIFCSP
ncbi:hypothetical protein B484DRAFT_159537 [Ochromonadaceae sp. CCMP2298]|nr:hypothetical protein B484DRAFT_159537 [Ochromonadaceae sp. CCMP2298]